MLTIVPGEVPSDTLVFRPEDERECLSGSGMSAREAIKKAIESGHAEVFMAVDEQGIPVVYWGAATTPDDESTAWVWLLATPELLRHGRQFLRESKRWIAALHTQFPVINNFVDSRNAVHIEWIKRMGFNVEYDYTTQGVDGTPFVYFWRRDPCVTPS